VGEQTALSRGHHRPLRSTTLLLPTDWYVQVVIAFVSGRRGILDVLCYCTLSTTVNNKVSCGREIARQSSSRSNRSAGVYAVDHKIVDAEVPHARVGYDGPCKIHLDVVWLLCTTCLLYIIPYGGYVVAPRRLAALAHMGKVDHKTRLFHRWTTMPNSVVLSQNCVS